MYSRILQTKTHMTSTSSVLSTDRRGKIAVNKQDAGQRYGVDNRLQLSVVQAPTGHTIPMRKNPMLQTDRST
jgi:hypothetical protein